MVLPETALDSAPTAPLASLDEQPTGASGTRLKVATRPATVGATWMDLFHPGAPSNLSLEARIRVVADVAGALIQIHDNSGMPRPHRCHGRLTPRHVLVGVDGSASLFNAKEPFSKLLPAQPDLGYLAPELLTQAGPANQQSDVFSMGVLLWEALDNGRLFPHRRAAAISRLIARRSLPTPRIQEEWALRLGEVALKALSFTPEERYPNGTAFWLALREYLPAPDSARTELSRLAQRALKLELTSDIREAPPYLVPSHVVLSGSSRPARTSLLEYPAQESSARYSMRPEPSTRQSSPLSPPPERFPSDSPEWSISEPPPSPPTAPTDGLRQTPPSATPPRPAEPSVPSSPVSTLQVNLPRDLVDVSLPFYLASSQPAPRPFPWGALSFAALIFFGVGAAVAFGAVTALRTVSTVAPEPARLPQVPAAQAVSVAPTKPKSSEPSPAAPQLALPQAASPADPIPPSDLSPPSAETAPSDGARTRAKGTGSGGGNQHSARRAKSNKPRSNRAAVKPAPALEEAAKAEPAAESLPFIEQPY